MTRNEMTQVESSEIGKKEKGLYLVMLKFDLINTLQPNNCKTGKMKQEPFLAW